MVRTTPAYINRSGMLLLLRSIPGFAARMQVFLGELNKFATLSSQRFTSVVTLDADAGISVKLSGATGEVVVVTALKRASGEEKLAQTDTGTTRTVWWQPHVCVCVRVRVCVCVGKWPEEMFVRWF